MEQVLQFLSDQNRPFTINDIVQGLGQKLGKTQMATMLNQLVSENRVLEKSCGKQKIYCVAQSSKIPLKDMSCNVLEMERECCKLTIKLNDIEKELAEKTSRLKQLEGQPVKEKILQQKNQLVEDINDMKSKLETHQGTSFDEKDKENIEKDYSNVVKAYKKRKRLCTDMIEAIFENYPKPKKTLLQEIGIETDEDVNFQIKVQVE